MIRFESDYLEGALPEIMEALLKTNRLQTAGYGNDPYCAMAAEKIKAECGADKADVHFLMGGTQANICVIASALRPHQSVIAAESAHINVHETGSVEASGHKVSVIPSTDGKIGAEQIAELVNQHRSDESFEHTVQPAMVYISQPTETGTVYTRSELSDISRVCRKLGLLLFLDGARLSCSLAIDACPSLKEIARLCDVFYIGGTKHGALFGEAVVITNEALKKDFRYIIKQRGGMLAKGRLLGVQFDTMFTDGLYYKIGRHEMELADKLRAAFKAQGIEFYYDSPTNQLFPILSKAQCDTLSEKYSFSKQKTLHDGRIVTRFCTSWATTEDDIRRLIGDMNTPKIEIIRGDITKQAVDAIVNAANTSLLGGGGVDGAIHRAAGKELLAECRTLGGCKTGEAKITKGYALPAKYVIHTPGPVWHGGDKHEAELLSSCYRSCLELASRYGLKTVDFPSISTGVYSFPLKLAAPIAISTIAEYLKEHPEIERVRMVCFDDKTAEYYRNALEKLQ